MMKGCLPGLPVGNGSPALGAAAAWVKFNGANGNIQAGYNVRSVVRNAVGDFTITFHRPFMTPHFACLVTAQPAAAGSLLGQVHLSDAGTAGAKRVLFIVPTVGAADPTSGHFVAFGES